MAKLPRNYGKAQAGSTRGICAWLKMALIVSLLTVLWERPSAGAGWIEAMARSLSEGDGINFQAIPRSFLSDAPDFIASTQQGINFSNTTLVSNFVEANGPTDLSPTFTYEHINNGGLSLTGPLWFQLTADTLWTDLYLDLEQDRFIFANHHLMRSSELGMIVPLFFGPWSNWPRATGGMKKAGMGDIILSRTGPLRFQLKADAIRTDLYLDLDQDHFIFANHHLTRSWELGMIVPLFFRPWSSWPGVTGGMEEASMGDIILQTQYKFPRKQLWWPNVMLRGQVKLPMGDKVGFWGTGETDFKALLMVSQSFGPLTPHVNFGVKWTTEGSKQNDLSYVAGLYAQVRPSLSLILDVLGRWEPHGDGIGDHTINLALGAKWYVHRNFLLNTSIFLPMKQAGGYRTDVTGTIRVEYLF